MDLARSRVLLIRATASLALVAGALHLIGCAHAPATDGEPSAPPGWTVESWDHGVFNIRNGENIYTAICDGTETVFGGEVSLVSSDGSVSLRNGSQQFQGSVPTCDLAVGLVGHTVQPLDANLLPAGGKEKDPDGWAVTMTHSGSSLMLKR